MLFESRGVRFVPEQSIRLPAIWSPPQVARQRFTDSAVRKVTVGSLAWRDLMENVDGTTEKEKVYKETTDQGHARVSLCASTTKGREKKAGGTCAADHAQSPQPLVSSARILAMARSADFRASA
jgi:hypothetical protein